MRILLSFAALVLGTAATSPAIQQGAGPTVADRPGADTVCRDRIHTVRAERGLPALERAPAAPDESLFIAAVDHRIDGCSVMVMRNDTSDVRPLPAPDQGPALRRIGAQ